MLIVDSGPLVAAARSQESHHNECQVLLKEAKPPVIVPQLAVTEAGYLLRKRTGPHAEAAFTKLIASGRLVTEPVLDSEWDRVAELMQRYLDMPLSAVDASLIVLAERYEADTVATLDRRLVAVRPKHIEALTLVP